MEIEKKSTSNYVIDNPKNPLKNKNISDKNYSNFVRRAVSNWESKKEIWPLQYGHILTSIPTVATGYYVNKFVRKSLVLTTYGAFSSYFISTVFPAVTIAVIHEIGTIDKMISTNLDKIENFSCPICDQVRSGAINSVLGTIHPLLFAYVFNFPLMSKMKNYNLPNLTKNPKGVVGYAWEITKNMKTKLFYFATFNFITGMIMTALEQYSFYTYVMPKIYSENKASQQLNEK